MLLTRAPLSLRASPQASFDLHVLSPPPAFVLSQDQTLRSRRVARAEARDFTLMSLGDLTSDHVAACAEAHAELADEGSLYFQSLKEPGLESRSPMQRADDSGTAC